MPRVTRRGLAINPAINNFSAKEIRAGRVFFGQRDERESTNLTDSALIEPVCLRCGESETRDSDCREGRRFGMAAQGDVGDLP
jgi:hypothetical protein